MFISPLDVVLGPRRVVQPDVLFISQDRLGIIGDHIAGAPDLVVEVNSPGSWRRDRVDKKALYEQAGVKEFWIIDPDAEGIEVFTLVKGAYRLHGRAVADATASSKLLPGFKATFNELAV
ncbi:MAG: Uma2 family endonuclease [Proteobacteria bacterium]|nr:Uma2 family endonuclease [Pseudomonadota bacterium]